MNTEITRRNDRDPTGHDDGARTPAARPPVDVHEDAGGITLKADLPGVAREGLELNVEGDTLTLEARAEVPVPAELRSVYAEARAARFRRSFVLSDELDSSAVDASLHNGVLTLRIPRRAEAQPRRIEVRGG